MQYSNADVLGKYMNIGMIKFILLNIITLGIYSLFYQHKFNKALGSLDIQPFAEKARMRFTLMLAFWGAGVVAQVIAAVAENDAIDTIGIVLSLISSILSIIWSYDIRAGIRAYCSKTYGIDYTANAILVFFFPCLTLIYATNNIPNEVEFHKQINNHSQK